MKYLIKTPGRTGSHIITSYLRNNNIECVHCQEAWLPDDPHNWVFINSKRHSWWDMVCSRVVTSYTKEYGPYTPQELKIDTDLEYLLDSAAYTKFRYDLYKQQQIYNPWAKSVTLYLEDILKNVDILTNIVYADTSVALDPYYTSPYKFEDVINNYHELKMQFEKATKGVL